MTATKDIVFTRGDDYELTATFVDNSTPPLPLFWSDMTFAAQIRRYEDDMTVAASFTIDATGLASGILVLSLSDTTTATLAGGYVWDLQMTDTNGVISTLLAGQVTVQRDVTRLA